MCFTFTKTNKFCLPGLKVSEVGDEKKEKIEEGGRDNWNVCECLRGGGWI